MPPAATPPPNRPQTGFLGISRVNCIHRHCFARGFIVAVFDRGVGVGRFGHACAVAFFGRGVAVGVEADRRGIAVAPMSSAAVRRLLRLARRAWWIVHRDPVPPVLRHPRLASCASVALAAAGILPRLDPVRRLLALHPKFIEYLLARPIPGVIVRPLRIRRDGIQKTETSETSQASQNGPGAA